MHDPTLTTESDILQEIASARNRVCAALLAAYPDGGDWDETIRKRLWGDLNVHPKTGFEPNPPGPDRLVCWVGPDSDYSLPPSRQEIADALTELQKSMGPDARHISMWRLLAWLRDSQTTPPAA